ncbi:carbohydrate kinase family protein [bacterium]|nr:carbohydrate kinase family protein [bacterium]
MLQNTPEKKISDISVLVVGTTCCDITNPDFDFFNNIAGDGFVSDSSRMVEVKPEWLELKTKFYAMGGGSLNIAPLVSIAGTSAGILTSLGIKEKTYDIQGRFMLNIMEKTGTYPIIIPHKTLPSSSSFIRPAQPGKREAIFHAPNAVDDLDIESESVFAKITQLQPGAIIHYVYSGVARIMDSEKGRKLARVMEKLKKLGYITMVDPHTLSRDPKKSISDGEIIEGYKLLKPVLPHLSWFFSSEVEAKMIANSFSYSIRGKNQEDKNKKFLLRLADEFNTDNSPRIFGITAGADIYVLYLSPRGKRIGPISIKSRYIIVEANKFVGAGDSFRAGFEVEWTQDRTYLEKFQAGEIKEADLVRLCLMGHLLAACYVTRTPSSQYGNIPEYQNMEEIVSSGITFSEKETLLSALKIK